MSPPPLDPTTLDRRLGLTLALLLGGLLANNLLPYLGVKDDSCQAMFSKLDYGDGVSKGNNHLFVPQAWVTDLWDGWFDVRATLDPPAPKDSFAGQLQGWLNTPERQLNREAVRVVVWQLCGLGHEVHLSMEDRLGRPFRGPACAEPSLSRPHLWIPVRLYEPSAPAEGW